MKILDKARFWEQQFESREFEEIPRVIENCVGIGKAYRKGPFEVCIDTHVIVDQTYLFPHIITDFALAPPTEKLYQVRGESWRMNFNTRVWRVWDGLPGSATSYVSVEDVLYLLDALADPILLPTCIGLSIGCDDIIEKYMRLQ